VIMGPDVILADEPTGNVDWEMSQRLMSLLIELNMIRTTKNQISARVLRIANRKLQLAGADL